MDDSATPHELQVEESAAGERLDRWLVATDIDFTRSRWQRLIEQGCVLVDGEAQPARYRLQGGERVCIDVPPPEIVDLEPDPDVPFDILYEDEDLAVVLKPTGVVVHPAPGHRSHTLVHGLLARLSSLSGVGGRMRPGIVHRLDRDTSGLMVVAKNDAAHHSLQEQLRARTLGRIYECICWGHPEPERGRVDLPLDRDPRQRKRRAVVEGGRRAITDYRTLLRLVSAAHLRLRLRTGRTHQIRVHLAHLGHPVLSDSLYGGDAGRLRGVHPDYRPQLSAALALLEGQALHAVELHLQHPSSAEEMRFTAPLPASFLAAREHLLPPGV